MKYLNKKNNSSLIWLIAALSVVLAALILVAVLLSNGKADPADPTGGSQTTGGSDHSDPTGAPTQPSADDLQIETPYAVLTYPGEWSGFLQVDKIPGDPYRVVFTAKLDSGIRQELFTVIFGGAQEGAIGVVKASGKEVPIHVSVVEIKPGDNWTANETGVIYAMQECLNDVLLGLNLTSPQEKPQETQPALPPADDEAMIIDTPAGEFRYPSRWQDYLKLEIREEGVYTVEFYTVLAGFDPVHLFDIHLGGDQGIYVTDLDAPDGTVYQLYVDIFEIEVNDDWTDAQRAVVLAMQEDINVLLAEFN